MEAYLASLSPEDRAELEKRVITQKTESSPESTGLPSGAVQSETADLSSCPAQIVFSYRTSSGAGALAGEHFMLQLTDSLTAAGLSSWNGMQVPPGSNWRKEWAERTLAAQVMVPLLSPDFFTSEACIGVDVGRQPQSADHSSISRAV